jgi:hypothetical protein
VGEVKKVDNRIIKKAFSVGRYNDLAKYIHKQYESGDRVVDGVGVPVGHEMLTEEEHALLLMPRNLSFVAAVMRNEQMFFSTVITGEKSWAFYQCDEQMSETTLKVMTPDSIVLFLKELFGVSALVATDTSMTLSPVGLLTLMTLADVIKRKKLESLVLQLVSDEPLDAKALEDVFKLTFESGDLRWYLPFVMEAFGPFGALESVVSQQKIDFKKGLKELETLGLIAVDKIHLNLTDSGASLVTKMLEPRGLLSFRSLFFDQGNLQHLPVAFCMLGEQIYLIMPVDGGSHYCFKSIDEAKFDELVEMVIGPGDAPQMVEVVKSKKETAKVRASSVSEAPTSTPTSNPTPAPTPSKTQTKFCKYCGTQLSAEANFCKACGKSVAKSKG